MKNKSNIYKFNNNKPTMKEETIQPTTTRNKTQCNQEPKKKKT